MPHKILAQLCKVFMKHHQLLIKTGEVTNFSLVFDQVGMIEMQLRICRRMVFPKRELALSNPYQRRFYNWDFIGLRVF